VLSAREKEDGAMNDLLEVLVAGNLYDEPRIVERENAMLATATICVRRSELTPDGILDDIRICLPIEVIGAVPAHSFAKQHRKGSRVALRGYLDERGKPGGAVRLVIVVERLLHLDPPHESRLREREQQPPVSPVPNAEPPIERGTSLRAPWEP
jgi:hypothetical protein